MILPAMLLTALACLVIVIVGKSAIVRVVFLKLTLDASALAVLGFSGVHETGELRSLAMVMVSFGLVICFLFLVFPRGTRAR